ncbi:MAG TPA: polysaccharide biosynthesis/export family protein [Candidatus Sulfotelmatobacter sp.]|nr:polysaccharide biosynthesis/export family protein [Candidatus Sulfotelmatobacter sp.]
MATNHWNIAVFLLGAALFSPPLHGQAQSQQPAAPIGTAPAPPPVQNVESDASHPQPGQRNPRYRIEADDILDLSFRYTPEFDQEVTVQPDGFVQLKGLSTDVHVQGLTVPQVIETLKKAYAGVLNDPVISVVLRDFEKPYFIAGGQVGKPGKYDLRGDTTATQAIAIAGGFVDFAKSKQVLLFRHYSGDTFEVKVLNLKQILKKKDIQEDVMLQPGDMLYVPKTAMAAIDRFLPRSSLGTYFAPAIL